MMSSLATFSGEVPQAEITLCASMIWNRNKLGLNVYTEHDLKTEARGLNVDTEHDLKTGARGLNVYTEHDLKTGSRGLNVYTEQELKQEQEG